MAVLLSSNPEVSIANMSYTQKDFNTIYPELLNLVKKLTYKWDPSISNESDPGVVLIKLNALIADKCNYNSDKNILETFPLSVTQESNARQLYEQLGYYMKWYQSAYAQIHISFIDEDTIDKVTNDDYFEIPPFTTISDTDNTIVYTLLGTSGSFIPTQNNKVFFKGDNKVVVFDAIQGIPVKYDINGETTITSANLDSNNRIYFGTNDIAENGIFITHKDSNDYSTWIRKDNLRVENLGNTYYKFGVLPGSDTCYLEFPADAETILENGIEITYIKTLGDEGIVPSYFIEKFYNDLTVKTSSAEVGNLLLTTDNVKMVNYSSSEGGKDKETINEAYRGYQSKIGTFNTLVTLRDYINACLQSGLVSNAIVTDRGNDIQYSYEIMSSVNDVNSSIKEVEKTSDDEVMMNAFDLKMYLLQYVSSNIDNANKYMQTFKLQPDSLRGNVESYILDQKCISHDYIDIARPTDKFSHYCLFKNKYPVNVRITPKYILSDTEQDSVQENVKKALYEQLNSKYTDFGTTISTSNLKNIIFDSDSRIADVTVYNIYYETFVTYWDGKQFKEISLNNSTDVEKKLQLDNKYIVQDSLGLVDIKVNDKLIFDINTPLYNKNKTYNKNFITKHTEDKVDKLYLCKEDGVTGTWDSDKWIEITNFSDNNTYNQGVPVAYNGFIYTAKGNIEEVGPFNIDNWTKLDANQINDTTWALYRFRYNKENNIWQISDNSTDKFDENTKTYNPQWVELKEDITNYFTYKNNEHILVDGEIVIIEFTPIEQFKNEIYVKSILAGITPLFVQDSEFDFDINQGKPQIDEDIDNPIRDIKKIRTNVDIELTSVKNTYKLRENESIQLYAPNLIEDRTYSNYVKYDYNISTDIAAKSNYELKPNEYIGFYWKDEDSDDALYQYYIYGEGNIICPSFTITAGTPQGNDEGVRPTEILYSKKVDVGTGDKPRYICSTKKTQPIDPELSDIVANDFRKFLSSSKNIVNKYFNGVKLVEGTKLYWILNNRADDRYILFNSCSEEDYSSSKTYNKGDFAKHDSKCWECLQDGVTGEWEEDFWALSEYNQYILNTGEYIFYTNNELTEFNILGTGTKIQRSSDFSEWSVEVIDSAKVTENGAAALTNSWFMLPLDTTASIQEQQYYNIPSNCTFKIVKNDEAEFNIVLGSHTLTSLYGYTLSYSSVTNPTDDDFEELPDIVTIDSEGWIGRSMFAINSQPGKEQILLDGQSITFYKNNDEEIEINGKNIHYADDDDKFIYYPIVLQFDNIISSEGVSGDIYVYKIENGELVYSSAYIYCKYMNTNSIRYSSFGGASLIFPGGSKDEDAIEFKFNVIEYNDNQRYLLPLYNSYTSDINTLRVEMKYEDGEYEAVKTFNERTLTFENSGTYYLGLPVRASGEYTIKVVLLNNSSNEKKLITLNKLYKSSIAQNILDNNKYDTYINLINNVFDTNGIFNYTYSTLEGATIENPLAADSFMLPYHIYNKFTICEMDVYSITPNITTR